MSTTLIKTCRKCGAKLFGEGKICGACVLETALGPLVNDDVDLAGNDRIKSQSPMMEFGDYELLEEIGRGGQGVVYRARQKSLNRTVALKVIGLGHFASTPHLKRFRHEAEAAASLEHPQIVPIYEIGERDGSCYFSMKYVEGGQLDQVIRREPMSPRHASELLVKISRTVQFAHEHGILHRDIKPGNILLDKKGEPHLTDFGLARLIEQESTVTNSFDVLGTPSYMAPEQAAGRTKELTAAADVYSLGAVFYQMLTGEAPFAGGTTYETIRMVLETEPRNPRARNPNVDVDLATICLKCLEKQPAKRYSSATALAEDLERWLHHEPILARPTNVFTRTRKWVRRSPAKAALAPALAVIAVLVLLSFWNREPAAPANGIAVLPFENLSADRENSFLADGIQDDILTKLAKIADLKVISRTSVMQYRGERNTRKIGQALRVSHVLEGSVRKLGGKIHMNAQLVDTRSDAHIWADQYDVETENSLGLPGEIARQVADQLRAKISQQEKIAIRERPTNDLRAYELYSEALAIVIYADPVGEARSSARKLQLLEEATQRDPNFALAYCAIAKAQTDFSDDAQHLELAKRAADTAVRIRPDMGEAHRELGRYYFSHKDNDLAVQELNIALRMLPNDSETLRVVAEFDRQRGRWDESLAEFKKAHELDPGNIEISHHLLLTYQKMRRHGEAQRLADESLWMGKVPRPWYCMYSAAIKRGQGDLDGSQASLAEIPEDFNPDEIFAYNRFITPFLRRDYEEAKRIIATTPPHYARLVFGGDAPNTWYDGMIARLQGDEAKAQLAFQTERTVVEAMRANKLKDDYTYFTWMSRIDAGLGKKDDAIREARQAVELLPVTRDAMVGPDLVTNLALVYALVGERDLAIKQLQIVAKMPGGPYYGALRFDPFWDPLRGDPRFEKIVADLKPKAAK